MDKRLQTVAVLGTLVVSFITVYFFLKGAIK